MVCLNHIHSHIISFSEYLEVPRELWFWKLLGAFYRLVAPVDESCFFKYLDLQS